MILLDTCTIVWNALEPGLLSKEAKKAIERANRQDGCYFCDLSLWEIAMLIKKGRLDPGTDYKTFIDLLFQTDKFEVIGIDADIAYTAVSLTDKVNQDPVDRVLVATAIVKRVSLVTPDKNLREAGCVETIW